MKNIEERLSTALKEAIRDHIGYRAFTTAEAFDAWEANRIGGVRLPDGSKLPKRLYAAIRAEVQALTKFAPQQHADHSPAFFEAAILRNGAYLYAFLPSVARKIGFGKDVPKSHKDPTNRPALFERRAA